MKIHNFFTTEKLAGKKEITISDAELLHQWGKVLRFNVGEQVRLFDNSSEEFLAEIISLDRKIAELKIISSQPCASLPKKEITIYFSLIKKDKMEWLIEKCTEIGVSHFQPIISERSENKGFNLERAKKIIKESCEQSGRAIMPTVAEPIALSLAIKSVSQTALAFDSSSPDFKPNEASQANKAVSCLVGPEGGFTPNEIEMFKSTGIKIYSFGSQTLRAETAGIVGATLLLLGN